MQKYYWIDCTPLGCLTLGNLFHTTYSLLFRFKESSTQNQRFPFSVIRQAFVEDLRDSGQNILCHIGISQIFRFIAKIETARSIAAITVNIVQLN